MQLDYNQLSAITKIMAFLEDVSLQSRNTRNQYELSLAKCYYDSLMEFTKEGSNESIKEFIGQLALQDSTDRLSTVLLTGLLSVIEDI